MGVAVYWLFMLPYCADKFRTNNKGLAREVVRTLNMQVFWEIDEEGLKRPIFVGPAPNMAHRVGSGGRVIIKEDDVLAAAKVRRAYNRDGVEGAIAALDELGLFDGPIAPF